MKYLYRVLVLYIVLCIGCEKSEVGSDSPSTNSLAIRFESIYDIDIINIAVFEGWVEPKQSDVYEGTTNFFAVGRVRGAELDLSLESGPYTILAYYKDFDKSFVEKINLSRDTAVTLLFNERLQTDLYNYDGLVYSPGETITFHFKPHNIKKGYNVRLFADEKPIRVDMFNGVGDYTFDKVGDVKLKIEVSYSDGFIETKQYVVKVVDDKTIDNVWNVMDESYLEQDLWQYHNRISYPSDTTINNIEYNKNIIINGLFGFYNFDFSGGTLKQIVINHGNIAMDPTFIMQRIVDSHKQLFDDPIKTYSDEHLEYAKGSYKIVLKREKNSDVNSYITRLY